MARPTPRVEHLFWKVPREKRVALTADIVNRTGSAIVFTRTRHGADRVARQLGQAGVKAVPIHGRRSQAQRDQALAQFTKGRAPALVATDVAARGIHVDGVGCVVHFDMADDPKDYVHRSGRTGRAGATGLVVSLVVDDGTRPCTRAAAPGRPHRAVHRPRPRPAGRRRPSAVLDLRPSLRSIPAWRGARRRRRRPGLRRPPSARPTSGGTSLASGDTIATETKRAPAGRRSATASGASAAMATWRGLGDHRRGPARRARRTKRSGRPRAQPRRRAGVRHVSSYDPDRGFGFISRRGGSDVFVHVSALAGNQVLEPGQRAVRAGAGATGPAGPQRRAGLLTPAAHRWASLTRNDPHPIRRPSASTRLLRDATAGAPPPTSPAVSRDARSLST